MDKIQKWYDLRSAKELLRHAESHYKMSKFDIRVYTALQSLESQQDGFCKDIVKQHRVIARIANVAKDTVRASLLRMKDQGLIEYIPGDRDYSKKIASRIRRLSITELEANRIDQKPAYRLTRRLRNRSIQYGDDVVKPQWSVAITNRIYASKPNVQGNKIKRPALLAAGCKSGQVLVELDFIAAEPSIIAELLGDYRDGYQIVAKAEGLNRDDVKSDFNGVVYGRSTAVAKALALGWNAPATIEYFRRIDDLRRKIRRPNGNPVRKIETLSGEIIECRPGTKCFSGTLLSYYAQGSIADFINHASLEIIDLEAEKGWRFVSTCHDSVYVCARLEQVSELEEIILKKAKKQQSTIRTRTNITKPIT